MNQKIIVHTSNQTINAKRKQIADEIKNFSNHAHLTP